MAPPLVLAQQLSYTSINQTNITHTYNTHTMLSLGPAQRARLVQHRVHVRVALDCPNHQLHDDRQRVIRRQLLVPGRHALHVVLECDGIVELCELMSVRIDVWNQG